MLALGYSRQPMPTGIRVACAAIKFLAVALLLLMLFEPTWVGQTPKPGSNDFLVLVDNGEGMQIQEAGKTLDDLKSAHQSTTSWFGELDELFRLETFTFDSRLRKANGFEGIDFNGQRSDLVHSVESMAQRYAKRPLAGMFVFSDGNATDAERLEELDVEVPIFPVIVESEKTRRDMAVGEISVADSAFEDAPITISASAKVEGMKGKTAILTVTDSEGVEVHQEEHKIATDEETHPFRVRFRPVKTGVSFYEIAVRDSAEKSSEVTLRNNAQTIAIDRGRGPYRVLYLTGRPNWEYKFLRRALAPDDEIDLVGLIRVAKREPKFVWRGRKGEATNPLFRGFQKNLPEGEKSYDKPVLIRLNVADSEELRGGFPKERDILFSDYHCIIIDDLEAEFFTEDQQLLIEKFVNLRGGSVLMLGGQESMQWGDYSRTPIGQMLPVYLDQFAKGKPAAGATLKLTREGWLEPWARLRLTEEEEDIRLAHMPDFRAINQLKAIKPGATPVATVVDAERRTYPALVTHHFGEGRVAVMTIGDVWRWGMKDESLHEDMDKWWRQLVRWLVADVPEFIQVSTEWADERGFAKRKVEVRVRNREFRPEENATVELRIVHPGLADDEEFSKVFAEPSLEEPGLFTAEFACAESGAHHVTAVVDDADGVRLGESEAGWSWNPAAEEFASLRANREFLADLAERTGGRLVEKAELKDFVRGLPTMEVPITETWARPLWHQAWVFLLAILLFAAEWGLRRWKGLA